MPTRHRLKIVQLTGQFVAESPHSLAVRFAGGCDSGHVSFGQLATVSYFARG